MLVGTWRHSYTLRPPTPGLDQATAGGGSGASSQGARTPPEGGVCPWPRADARNVLVRRV